MAELITLTKGLRPFELRFTDAEETVTIYFNPTDPDLLKRLMEVEKRIDGKLENVRKKTKRKDVNKAKDFINAAEEMKEIIYNEVDYAFGNKISDKVFEHCSPLTIINGKYFLTIFLETMSPVIAKIITEENESLMKHIGEYIDA